MKIFSLVTFIIISLVAYSQTIKPEYAKDSIGKQTTICGTVTSTRSTEKATFLNMGGKYPNNTFTVMIFKNNVATFSYQLSTLEGEDICVTGLVKKYKGKANIMVKNEKQIKQQATLIKPRE